VLKPSEIAMIKSWIVSAEKALECLSALQGAKAGNWTLAIAEIELKSLISGWEKVVEAQS